MTCAMRLNVLNGRYPLGIYSFFWLSVILDMSSTILTLRFVPQYQWVEANPLFYTLDPTLFFVIYILTNVSLFLLILHHQAQRGRGASLLYISIFVHGSLGMTNLIQLLRLQM
jgi:hypothetical protein